VSLGCVAGLIVADPATGLTLFGLQPIFPLDASTREGDRLVGPFSAAWYVVFMIPFFLLVPEVRAEVGAGGRRLAIKEIISTIRAIPSHRDMLIFLTANMLYMDGLWAIFAFGGIYGASVFGWGALELGMFGIIVIFTGVFGAIAGGLLDDRVGSKAVILASLILLFASVIGILSVDKTRIFFMQEVAPKTLGSAPFSSIGEKVFLAFAVLIGLVAAPLQAASRTLCARLAPRDKLTQFFGLLAFSGKVTAFLAPFVVAAVTSATGDQRLGVATIVVFLGCGMVLMLPVRTGRPS
jgi:UMF1 family MFS transporter